MTDALAATLALWSADPGDTTAAGVYAAMLDAVVLLPVRAVALAEQVAERTGLPAEREAELSLVTVALADGRRVLPAFTAADEVRRWQLEARPVQATLRSACQAVLDEGWHGIVVDPTTHAFVVGPAVVSALAGGALPVVADDPGERDVLDRPPGATALEDLADVLRRALAREPAVAAGWLLGNDPVTVGVLLKVPLDPPSLATVAGRLGRRLAPAHAGTVNLVPLAQEPSEQVPRLWP